MNSVCVFCGSASGTDPAFVETAKILGQQLAYQAITLIYGGSQAGIMGAVANACLASGGKVIGIIPEFLAHKEIAHEGVTELIRVSSMHERKLKMSQLAEGFIALPGGFGTLEELCEILTWAQLGIVKEPVAILNQAGYYDHLVALFQHMMESGLLKKSNYELLIQESEVSELLEKMHEFKRVQGTMDGYDLT